MMKLVNYFMAMICLGALSCKSKYQPEYSHLIIGEWTFIKKELKYGTKIDPTEPPPIEVGFKSGYAFKESGVCEDKLGYFKHVISDHTHYAEFLGTWTRYYLRDNRLGIFDLAQKEWKEYEILKLGSKTLKIALNDSVYAIYEKSNYKLDPEVPFDEIIVSTSSCYTGFPVKDIVISRNSQIVINSEKFTQGEGLFSSKITSEEFEEIEKKFRIADLKRLKARYDDGRGDCNEITISLIQNGRIYKTISDRGSQSPTELYWAYFPVTFLDQKLDLRSLPRTKFYRTRISSFEKENKLIRLAKSESYYLTDLLNKADVVDTLFIEKYTLRASDEQGSLKMTSDGRYFKFRLKNGKFTILDLGYNFLERNDLLKRLSPLPYYE